MALRQHQPVDWLGKQVNGEVVGEGQVWVESGPGAEVARRWVLGRSRTTLSRLWVGIQEKRIRFSGSKTHPLWYADVGREAKKGIVVEAIGG